MRTLLTGLQNHTNRVVFRNVLTHINKSLGPRHKLAKLRRRVRSMPTLCRSPRCSWGRAHGHLRYMLRAAGKVKRARPLDIGVAEIARSRLKQDKTRDFKIRRLGTRPNGTSGLQSSVRNFWPRPRPSAWCAVKASILKQENQPRGGLLASWDRLNSAGPIGRSWTI